MNTWEHEINEGRVALLCHDYNQAEEHFRLALVSLSEMPEPWPDFEPRTQSLLGEVLFLKKNYAEAQFYFEESERNFREHFGYDVYSRAVNNYCLAEICLWLDDDLTALRYFGAAAPLLECVFHEDHRYRRRTAEFLGSDREIFTAQCFELENVRLHVERYARSLEQSEELASRREACDETMWTWIAFAKEQLQLDTDVARIEAYAALNHALALSTWCTSHVSPNSEVILSMMTEIAIMVRCDDVAARLAHANVALNTAMHGEHSVGTVKSKELLAALYAQQGQLKMAEDIFDSAFQSLAVLGESADLIMAVGIEIYEKLKSYRTCLQSADSLLSQASDHFQMSQFRQARKCLEKAKKKLSRQFPAASDVFLPLQQCMAEVYQRLGMLGAMQRASAQIELIKQTKQDQLEFMRVMRQRFPLAEWI